MYAPRLIQPHGRPPFNSRASQTGLLQMLQLPSSLQGPVQTVHLGPDGRGTSSPRHSSLPLQSGDGAPFRGRGRSSRERATRGFLGGLLLFLPKTCLRLTFSQSVVRRPQEAMERFCSLLQHLRLRVLFLLLFVASFLLHPLEFLVFRLPIFGDTCRCCRSWAPAPICNSAPAPIRCCS